MAANIATTNTSVVLFVFFDFNILKLINYGKI